MSIKLETVNRLVFLIGGTGAIIQIQYISLYVVFLLEDF